MPLRILIADDEEPARNELSFQLEQLDDVEIVDQATDGLQAVSLAEADGELTLDERAEIDRIVAQIGSAA